MSLNCLACGGTLGDVLFTINDLPLVDSFSSSLDHAQSVPRFSVEIRACHECDTVQIASPPDTSSIYKNYIYTSSSSPDLQAHFLDYAKFILDITGETNINLLEIGANDGLLLAQLKALGFNSMVAVDPSPQTANIAIDGVNIINDFFSESSVSLLDRGSFDIIIANNCFSHIPNLTEVLRQCKLLLSQSGTILIEVQSTLDLINDCIFDYIYHEHYFYHTVSSFQKLAEIAGLELYRVEHVPTKGGSYRILLGHPSSHNIDSSVKYWIYRESFSCISRPDTWISLQKYLLSIKESLTDWLLSHYPGKIYAYGASATSTVFLQYMGIEKYIHAIVDDNPKRQGLYAPGSGLKVVDFSHLSNAKACLLLAWRFAPMITPRLDNLPLHWVSPLPFLKTNK